MAHVSLDSAALRCPAMAPVRVSRRATRARAEHGAIAIFILLAMTFSLLAVTALVVDLGRVLIAIRETQTAADSAALAGANQLLWGKLAPDGTPYSDGENDIQTRCTRTYIQARVNGGVPDPSNPATIPPYMNVDDLTDQISEWGQGWFRVKPAVMATVRVARLSALDPAARAALSAGSSASMPFNAGLPTWDRSKGASGYSAGQGNKYGQTTAQAGNLQVVVERGILCRNIGQYTLHSCTENGECERSFLSIENSGDVNKVRRLAVFARAVKVTIRIRNMRLFFASFFNATFFDRIEVSSVASVDTYKPSDGGAVCLLKRDVSDPQRVQALCDAWQSNVLNPTTTGCCARCNNDDYLYMSQEYCNTPAVAGGPSLPAC